MQYVIFHGSFGSASGNWFPYLKQELITKGHKVLVPQFPTESYSEATANLTKDPNYKLEKFNLANWIKYFEKEVLPVLGSEDTVFIGHSLGPLTILHILSTFEIKLKAAYFIAPFFDLPESDPAYDQAIANFNARDLDFAKIKEKIVRSYVIYSDNDPYVAIEKSLEFANKLGAEPLLMKGKAHFNSETRLIKFPELLELLGKI